MQAEAVVLGQAQPVRGQAYQDMFVFEWWHDGNRRNDRLSMSLKDTKSLEGSSGHNCRVDQST